MLAATLDLDPLLDKILESLARVVTYDAVAILLKKADPKHNRYTIEITADDKKTEKKDRTMLEPLQFYTGRDRQLYELVVFSMDKNKVTGYISTPKNAPTPAVAK